MINEIKVLEERYNGIPVQFEMRNGQIMANATSMCQAFGKQFKDWERNQTTQELIAAYQRKFGILDDNIQIQNSPFRPNVSKTQCSESNILPNGNPTKLIEIVKGGNLPNMKNAGKPQGTWIHECLVLDLAMWLDVQFKIWCGDRIAELLRTGKTEVVKKELTVAEILKLTQDTIDKLENNIIELRPKADYHDTVLNKGKGKYLLSEVASELGITHPQLKFLLSSKGLNICYMVSSYQNNSFIPYADSILPNEDIEKRHTAYGTTSYFTEKALKIIHETFYKDCERLGITTGFKGLFDYYKKIDDNNKSYKNIQGVVRYDN